MGFVEFLKLVPNAPSPWSCECVCVCGQGCEGDFLLLKGCIIYCVTGWVESPVKKGVLILVNNPQSISPFSFIFLSHYGRDTVVFRQIG